METGSKAASAVKSLNLTGNDHPRSGTVWSFIRHPDASGRNDIGAMDKHSNKIAFFLLGATLALGLGWSAHLIGTAIVKMRQDNAIRVKGTSEQVIESDLAKWECGYTVRNADLKAASSDLEAARQQMEKFLTTSGLKPDDYEIGDIGIRRIMKKNAKGEHDTNVIDLYEMSQSVKVESKEIMKVKGISVSIAELVKSGIEISPESPQYLYSGLESLKMDLLGKATKNAYERAQIIADNGGGKLAGLSSASQGVFQITAVNSTETSDEGSYNTSTIKKSVKCVVTLEFNLGGR